VADTRVDSPSRAAEAIGVSAGDVSASAGDVGATTSPTIIDVDPIRAVPGGVEDLVGD
jgi:hypothetical protein